MITVKDVWPPIPLIPLLTWNTLIPSLLTLSDTVLEILTCDMSSCAVMTILMS